jgi:crotonobetainyl-CoA:carnitine CoA-transferase CaiB-like acyl-CoA transferase
MKDTLLSLLTYTATIYLNTGKEPSRMGSEHEYSIPWQAASARDGQFVLASPLNEAPR